MFRIMVMNGLLISLILIWTSAAKEHSAGNLIKSSTKPPTGPLNYSVSKPMVSLHETNKEILRRKFLCGSELGGVCVNKKKSCPSNLPSEKSPGKPYCSKKKDRCCYPDPTTAAPPTVVPTTTTTSEDVNWSDIRNACIKSNNYKTYQPLALDICKEKCVEEDAINCQSIEYSSAQQMCAISEARSDSDDFIEPCFVDGWVFAEIELNTGPTTGAPTTLAPSNTMINGQTTNPPTTTAPSNTTNNVSSCNLVWNYEEDRPLIMIRETKTIVPPIIDIEISEDPNRIPEGKKLIFACPGENNQFNHVQGTHTKLHGECISHEQFKVCVNNYPEILDLSQLSCSSKMQPSIIKQDNDTSYEKSCEDIGGELYKFGYIYGDYREFKDLDTKFCFREKDQTTLWTSTNIDRIEISPSMRSMDPANFRTARGLAMNTFYSQKSQQETLKEILDKEVKSVWNDKACRNHGGHCVRGGRPCPKHLPHHTSQGEPFCTSFYRCCYSDQCDPSTCTYEGKKGNCSLDSLPVTTGVGSQECKKGCQCYIKDNKTLDQFKSVQERKELSKLLKGTTYGGGSSPCNSKILQSSKKSSNYTRGLRNDLSCDIQWHPSLSKGYPPLIIADTGPKNIVPPFIQEGHENTYSVPSDTKLIISCPGEGNRNKFYDTEVQKLTNGFGFKATCIKTKIYIYRCDAKKEGYHLKDIGCKHRVFPSINQVLDDKFPTFCSNLRGYVYDITFATVKDENNKMVFHNLDISLCFEQVEQTTLWTKHFLNGRDISNKDFNNDPPDFRDPHDLFNNPMATIYTQRSIAKLFWEKLGVDKSKEYFCSETGFTYLQKGHLSPVGDFVTMAEQAATYLFANALPQWNVINSGGGNWLNLEEYIRKYADKNKDILEIYTGGYKVLVLKDIKGIDVKIYLSNNVEETSKRKKVPVPLGTWKVVYSTKLMEAVAFLVINDPFKQIDVKSFPTSKCDQLHKPPIALPQDEDAYKNAYKKGFTFCWTVKDFRTVLAPEGDPSDQAGPFVEFPPLPEAEAENNLLKFI